MALSSGRIPGVQVQLNHTSHAGSSRGWGVPSLTVFGKKRQAHLWLYLMRSQSSRNPKPRGIHLFPSPAFRCQVASGEGWPLAGPLKTHRGCLICHRLSLPLGTKDALFCSWSDDRLENPISPLTDFFFFLRNICTLWWRFPKTRFLFWTQIWCCHSRRGHLQECPTWSWSRPRGERALLWWRGREADHRSTSVSDGAFPLTFPGTSSYLKIQVFLLCFISV